MKKHVATAIFLVVLALGMVSPAVAQTSDDNETSTVNVTVKSETALDVKPDTLLYKQVKVGDRVNVTDNDHGYETMKVENTGSNPIQRVWADVDLPSTDPFGSGNDGPSSNHISSNFLQVKPSNNDPTEIKGNETTYHYVKRVEFTTNSHPLINVGDFEGAGGYSNVEVGRMRFGNNEFYFALGWDSTSCGTGSELRVAKTPTTPSALGTADFSSNNKPGFEVYNISASTGEYGITNETVALSMDTSVPDLDYSTEEQSYDVLTKCDGFGNVPQDSNHIKLVRYDIEAGNATNLQTGDGNTAEELLRSGGTSTDLSPGDSFGVDVAVQVPRGVPNGDISTGTLTVYSQAR